MLDHSESLAMPTNVLDALPGKIDVIPAESFKSELQYFEIFLMKILK